MEQPKAFVGVDNGKQGGITFLDEQGKILESVVMPIITKEYDIRQIAIILNRYNKKYDCFTILEKAHTMPLNGGKSNFTNGYQYGVMQTVLKVLGMPYEIVSAATWQKSIFQGLTVRDTKEASFEYCERRFPGYDFRKTERCRKFHDGKTDATCMAVYGFLRNSRG